MSARLLIGGRLAARFGAWAAAGVVFGLLAAVALPLAFGLRPLTVLSGSMEPAIGTGDVVVVERIEPRAARIGDIVTFRDPERSGRLITHRVRGVAVRDDEIRFTTKGDANNSVERWSLPPEGELSRVHFHVPVVGHVLSWTRTRIGRLAVLVVPLLLLGAYELYRIWRPRREPGGGDGSPEEVPGESAA